MQRALRLPYTLYFADESVTYRIIRCVNAGLGDRRTNPLHLCPRTFTEVCR